jgi:hypothetical protein
MDATPNLALPFLMAAQAQKHVTHNEALRALDAVVQLAVADKDLATPPGSPADGARYLVAASPTGAWSGQTGKVAAFQDGAWAFYTPRTGWLAWVADEDKLYVWTGSAWALPPRRDILTANRTYYVRSDGSDGNTGLANTSGGAFLTMQKAVDTVAGLDLSTYDVVIQVGTGTYTSPVTLKTIVGAGLVTLRGDTGTPSNVVISTTSADAIGGDGIVARYHLEGFRLTTATAGRCLNIAGGGLSVTFASLEFGSVPNGWYQISVGRNGSVVAGGNYAIVGGAPGGGNHIFCSNAYMSLAGRTVTLTGTPAFGEFIRSLFGGLVEAQAVTFSGSATGARYNVFGNAVLYTNGGGATYLPGNASGSASSGGEYL